MFGRMHDNVYVFVDIDPSSGEPRFCPGRTIRLLPCAFEERSSMDPEGSYASIKCRLRQHQRRKDNLATENAGSKQVESFDVAQFVPERPFPDWVKHRSKGGKVSLSAKSNGEASRRNDSSLSGGMMTLDLNNMRKDWKSRTTRRAESLRRTRVMQNRRPEAVRDFPGVVRPLAIPSDSPVAVYARTNGSSSRKRFGSIIAVGGDSYNSQDATPCVITESSQETEPLPLIDKTYLTLDQSKLPLEVKRALCDTCGLRVSVSLPCGSMSNETCTV